MRCDVSVIVEWDNVRLAEQDRCHRMLRQLRQQALESDRTVEILIPFDSEQVSQSTIDEAVQCYLTTPSGSGRALPCRVEPAQGLDYYQLKNFGVKKADGSVVVFLDSDVIPEDDWFCSLVEPFWQHPEIQVLAGHTYMDPIGLISRAFSLGWFFPLRDESRDLIKGARRFYANNIAFRREVIAAYPFPNMPDGMTRGSCTVLSQTLSRKKIPIWIQVAAKTSHPAPNGFRHFVVRGLAQGRDWAILQQLRAKPGWKIMFKAFRNMLSSSIRILTNTIGGGHKVGLRIWQMPFSIGLMCVFYLEICLGAWVHILAPQVSRRAWRL